MCAGQTGGVSHNAGTGSRHRRVWTRACARDYASRGSGPRRLGGRRARRATSPQPPAVIARGADGRATVWAVRVERLTVDGVLDEGVYQDVANLRFRWEYQPGSELFVVYNSSATPWAAAIPNWRTGRSSSRSTGCSVSSGSATASAAPSPRSSGGRPEASAARISSMIGRVSSTVPTAAHDP